jgi:hypothetical protein
VFFYSGVYGNTQTSRVIFKGFRNRTDCVAKSLIKQLCWNWEVMLPEHVNIDLLVVRPIAQAAQHKVHRVIK